jgi:hypothetical protein
MTKRTIFLVILSLALTASFCLAQGNVHYSLGFRYQLSSWQLKDVYVYETAEAVLSGDSTELGSEMGHMYGPIVSLSVDKFAFSVNYMMGAWEFPKQFTIVWDGSAWDTDDVIVKPKRSELIVTASYKVLPRMMIFLGVKNLIMKEEYEYANYTEYNDEFEAKGTGFGGGVSGSLPLTPNLQGYGTLGYLSLGGDFEGWGNLIFEGGLRLFPRNMPIYGSLGYRYESFTGSDVMNDAVLHGPILTVAYYR